MGSVEQLKLNQPELPWLEERTILLTVSGSHAYGTDIDTSDKDYVGICIPPEEYYLGMDKFIEYKTNKDNRRKNTKDDVDVTITHITKAISEALHGVPNFLEILFTREEDIVKITNAGKILIAHRDLFLSKSIFNKFRGYASSRVKKVVHTAKMGNSGDITYSTKDFMHAVRMYTSAIDILDTGTYSTYRPNREFLLDCRLGKYIYKEAIEIVEELDNKLVESNDNSGLRRKADYHKINELLIRINRAYIR